MSEDELLTSRQVAGQLKTTERTVLREIARGRFPNAFKVGWSWRIPRADLDAYINKQKRKRQAVT